MQRRLTGSRYEEIKSEVADLIEDFHLAYPLDTEELATQLGIEVLTEAWGLQLGYWNHGSSDGFTELVESAKGPKFKTHLNDLIQADRRNFTLAHEIGHVWLDHMRKGGNSSSEVLESEANFFASFLLAPDALVLAHVPSLCPVEIAGFFNVSRLAAQQIRNRVLRAATAGGCNREYNGRILRHASTVPFKGRKSDGEPRSAS